MIWVRSKQERYEHNNECIHGSQQSTYVFAHPNDYSNKVNLTFMDVDIRTAVKHEFTLLFPLRPVVNLSSYYCLNEVPIYVTHRVVVDLANEWAQQKKWKTQSLVCFTEKLRAHYYYVMREPANVFGFLRNAKLCWFSCSHLRSTFLTAWMIPQEITWTFYKSSKLRSRNGTASRDGYAL